MIKLLKKLANTYGISGYENDVSKIVEDEFNKFMDEVRIDKMGNVIGVRKGGKPSIMIAAHMDEIGLMVKSIDKDGFIKFVKIGGWFDQILLNTRVVVHGKKDVYGVIGSKPPHLMKEDERNKGIKADDMFIDIGAKSREEVEKLGIKIGTPISIDMELKELINGRMTGKALDDRIGVAMMIEAVRKARGEATIYAVGTVQEEVGLKGARTAAFSLNPDIAIVCEVAIAGDHPGIEEKNRNIKVDGGAVITVADASGRGLISHPAVLRWLQNIAEKNKIPYQLEVSEGGTTDAAVIHLTREGVPSGVISVPTRYMHSGVEIASINDIRNATKLLTKAIENANEFKL